MVANMEMDDEVINIGDNFNDLDLCPLIYEHLRASEADKRPSIDFMERIQNVIDANTRALLIDILVQVAEDFNLVPDTLYLAVNYIDRYLSGNAMNMSNLAVLGASCMMIALKYEEYPKRSLRNITGDRFFENEVFAMESVVLTYLRFELTTPTPKCFLRRYIRAAQEVNEVPSMELVSMANYVAELSLPAYHMLRYLPSLIAASAVFLAKYVFDPSKQPWEYTLYHPSDLPECVKDLHRLCCDAPNSFFRSVVKKYSQDKYGRVAKIDIPPSIPEEFFDDPEEFFSDAEEFSNDLSD